jgi:hypothetical protein
MWKMGRCFVRLSNHPQAFYAHVYKSRKEEEIARNEAGLNTAEAARTLTERTFSDPGAKACYEGTENCAHDKAIPKPLPRPRIGIQHLPPGRIDLRASRPAVKLFLAHWFEVGFKRIHAGHTDGRCFCRGTGQPPLPYPIAIVPGAPGAETCGPKRKRVFATVTEADAAIRDHDSINSYACEIAQHYHIGHRRIALTTE